MTRLIGPAQAERIFLYSSGSKRGLPVPTGTPVPLYADAQCTLPADVLSLTGGALAVSGGIPQTAIGDTMEAGLFQFPDVADPVVYTRVAGGPVVAFHPDTDQVQDALRARIVALEAGGTGDALLVHRAGAETITGVKTFSASPVVPTPSSATDVASKGYADGLVDDLSGVTNAAAARSALGLGDSATKNVGTSAGTVAGGDVLAATNTAVAAKVAKLSVPGQAMTLDRFYPVMASPYTTTLTNVTGGTVTSASSIASAVRVPGERPGAFRYSGTAIISGGSLSGVYQWQPIGGSSGPQQSQSPFTVEFDLDTVNGSFDIIFKRFTAAQARVAVDGQYLTRLATATPSDSTAQPCLLNVAGLSAGRHRIRVEFNKYGGFCGVNVQSSDSVLAVPVRRKRIIVVGDSYTEPTVADSTVNAFTGFGWVQALAHMLGVDAWSSGSGGTGYLNPGASARVKFRDRLTADVIAYSPDVVIWAGGHNDLTTNNAAYTPTALQTEAALCYSTLAAALPNTAQIVVGPLWGVGPEGIPGAGFAARDAIKAAADAAGLLWIDPQESPLDMPAQGSATLQASTSASATSFSSNVNYRIGTWLKIGAGAAQEVRQATNVTGSGPYTVTVAAMNSAHTANDPITETGPGWVTGTGRQGTTNGTGSADRYNGTDGTHPTQAGHEGLGIYLAQRLYFALSAG